VDWKHSSRVRTRGPVEPHEGNDSNDHIALVYEDTGDPGTPVFEKRG
jgi:hypothetical protein